MPANKTELESFIQKSIVDYLELTGHMVVRNYMGPLYCRRGSQLIARPNPNGGIPDLMSIKDGHCYFFEVKTSKGRLSEKQKVWHQKAKDHGVDVHVVRSVNDVIDVLMEDL